MPSPFPGMDPYLEDPIFWRGFHNMMIAEITGVLNADLPPGFAANYEERVYILPTQQIVYPDVVVMQEPSERPPLAGGGGGTAVVEPGVPHGVLTAYPEEMREGFVEVRTGDEWEEVVTIIEVLSPANKTIGNVGRELYLEKQHAVLESETHLMEIDLLRRGTHTVAAPLDKLRERGTWDHLVCLHRSTQRYTYEFWMNRLREPLPEVRVPLTQGIPDVVMDLQEVFTRTYDRGPYKRRVNYRKDPPVPLEPDDTAWADALLREKGLRD